MPEPEKVAASSQPPATGTQQQSYKGLLNDQCKKIWKHLPVYQTHNEGSEHQPKFRTTIWIDGLSYTSPNTFQQIKMSESDASKITYFAVMQKLKNEASRLVCEDKFFCKSILVEFAEKMNLQRPTYQTTPLGPPSNLFKSSSVFNNVTYTGDGRRTKKEAEQSAACAAILKYLETEAGNILPEIIKSKFNHYTVSKETQSIQIDTNRVIGVTLNETKADQGTIHTDTPPTNPSMPVTQTNIPQISTQALPQITQAPTILAQTPIVGTTSALTQQGTTIPVTNTHVPHIPSISDQAPTQTTAMPTVTHIPTVSNQAPTQTTPLSSNVVRPLKLEAPAVTVVEQPINLEAPTVTVVEPINLEAPTVTVVEPINLEAPAVTVVEPINLEAPAVTVAEPIKLEAPAVTVAEPIKLEAPAVTVVEPINLEAPAVTVVEPIKLEAPAVTVTPSTSGKKRNRRGKKNAQKRMRAENQLGMSAMVHGQVPAFSAQ